MSFYLWVVMNFDLIIVAIGSVFVNPTFYFLVSLIQLELRFQQASYMIFFKIMAICYLLFNVNSTQSHKLVLYKRRDFEFSLILMFGNFWLLIIWPMIGGMVKRFTTEILLFHWVKFYILSQLTSVRLDFNNLMYLSKTVNYEERQLMKTCLILSTTVGATDRLKLVK